MLVLSRKPNEGVWIGDNVFIRIVSVHGENVRVAISAPIEVPIHREEIVERRRAQEKNND